MLYFFIAEQRAQPCKHGAEEDPRARKDERHGRALHIKPRAALRLDPEKTVRRRQAAAERKGEREERRRRDQAGLHAARARDKAQRRAAEKLYKVRRPHGEREEREHDGEGAARSRGKAQPKRPHAAARTLDGKIEQQPVQQRVFGKSVFPIDDHLSASYLPL